MKSGEPPITRRAIHDSGGGNLPIRRVVIHATCPGVGYPAASKKGAASGTAKYFQMQSSGGSAHYICDVSGAEEHCVGENVIAWHAPPNSHTIGIEICGEASYTRAQWLSDQVWPAVEVAAARTRELCARYGLPARKLTVAQVKANAEGVCGHVDVSHAFRQTDHTDPGPNFPWDEFMHLVNSTSASAAAAGSKPALNWTEVLVDKLPTLNPGDDHKHVKTMRGLLWARGYEPKDMYSTKYGKDADDLADLTKQVNALKAKHKLAQDGVFGDGAWEAALS